MTLQFEQEMKALWQERVASKYLYRGMSTCDLKDPLDPKTDPFQEVRPQLFRLIEALERALAKGFTFTVHEDYSNLSFDLKDILKWSRRDLENAGLDFTSSYKSASGYSRNYQGSQLKQNFKYITDHLTKRIENSSPLLDMTEEDQAATSLINIWLSENKNGGSRVVIWVRRSALTLGANQCLPLGSLQAFSRSIMTQLKDKQLPMTQESAKSVLPNESEEFHYRLREPLSLRDVERIEKMEA
jgi:hypothetical protein